MKVEKIDHIHVCVKDLDAAMAFFKDVFGMEFDPVWELSEIVGLRDVRGPLGLDIVEITDPARRAGKGMVDTHKEGISAISLKVPNIEEAIAELEARGIKMASPLSQIGLVKQAYFDPTQTFGIQIELCEYPGDDLGAAAGPPRSDGLKAV